MGKQEIMPTDAYLFSNDWVRLPLDKRRHPRLGHHDSAESAERAQLAQDASLRDYREQRWGSAEQFVAHGDAVAPIELSMARDATERERTRAEELKAALDAVAHALHPHWPEGSSNAYSPEQLPGMIRAILFEAERYRRKADTAYGELEKELGLTQAARSAMNQHGARDREPFAEFVERLGKRAALADLVVAAVESVAASEENQR